MLPAALHLLDVDACLDTGRVYDYMARQCRDDVVSLPVPSSRENVDHRSSAFMLLLVFATTSFATAVALSTTRWAVRLRGFVRWAGAILLVGYALVALNNAAASAWLVGGPPTPITRAWWGEAVRSFWVSVTALLTGVWLWVVLRPGGARSGGRAASG